MKPLTCENGHILPTPFKPCPTCLHDAITAIEYFAPENKRERGKAMNLPKPVRSTK